MIVHESDNKEIKRKKKKLEMLINAIELLDENIETFKGLKNSNEKAALLLMEELSLIHYKNASLAYDRITPTMNLGQLKEHFNNPQGDLYNSIEVKIDRDKTIENLKFLKGYSKPVLNAMYRKLYNLDKKMSLRLRVRKGEKK